MDDPIPVEGEQVPPPSPSKRSHHRRTSSSYSNATDDRESSYYSFDNGLASPSISAAESVSGSSTAYSGLASGQSTPGGYVFMGTQSPNVLPMGAMNLGPPLVEVKPVEKMDVDV